MRSLLALLVAFALLAGAAGAQEVLTLQEAAASTVARHPDLQAAESRVAGAEARADAARAAFYPTLDAGIGANHSEASGSSGSGLTVTRAGGNTNYSIGFTGRQTVFDFGRRRSRVRAADETLQASLDDLEDTRQALLLTVSEAYFGVLREAAGVEIQEDNVRNAEELLRQAQGFYEAGTRARIDVTRAESDLANARVLLIQAQNLERRARVALGTAMGLPDAIESPLAVQGLPVPEWDVEEAFQAATGFRPDVLAARDRLEAARARVNLAVAEYRPTIDASGQYRMSDSDFPPEQNSWNLGMDISVPILSYPTLQAAVAEAEAAVSEQEALLASLLLRVRREVADQVLNVRASREAVEAADAGRKAAEDNHALASERYRVGVGSSIEVSEAQRLLVQARSQYAQARVDLELSLARLYRSTGTLDEGVLAAP